MKRAHLLLPIAIGIVIRLLLMPFTMQADSRFVGDIVAMHVDARQFVQPADAVDIALYPPLAYYTMFAYQSLITPLVPDIAELQKDGTLAQQTWYSDPLRFRKLFLLKLWVLPFDVACGVLLMRLFDNPHQRRLSAWFWYLNPVIIYTTAIHGQFDAVPICFTLGAIVAMRAGRYRLAGLALGIGAAFKLYPLLFLAPLLIGIKARDVRLQTGFIASMIFLLPYAGKLAHYRIEHSYYSFGLAGVVELTQGQAYYVFGVLYVLLLFYLWEHRRGHESLWAWLWILIAFYAQATFDLHYLAWVMPFAVLMVVRVPRSRFAWAVVLISAFALTTRDMPFGYVLPLDYEAMRTLPTLSVWIGQIIPMSLFNRAVHSILIASLLWIGYLAYAESQSA